MILRHICEACGKTEDLDADEGYRQGWDYPPNMGAFGVVSPRTCGECGIDRTLWWRIVMANKNGEVYSATEADHTLLVRIAGEPGSIEVTS